MDGPRPLMLGLVGESAAGKTTLVRGVVRILGGAGVTPLCLDDYHRFSRTELSARGLTAADPQANDLELMLSHLQALRAGRRISKPVYDHRQGTLGGPEVVAPTGLVVAYGMLTLTPPGATELFDLTVYLEPAPELRRAWRLARDVSERGYTPAEVNAREPERDRAAAAYIRVQRPLADVVVHVRPNAAADDVLDTTLALRARGAAQDPLCAALAAAALPGLAVSRLERDEDGRPCDRVQLEATITPETAAMAAAIIWQQLPDYTVAPLEMLGQIREGTHVRHAPALALAQLLIVARLVEGRGR